MPGTFIRNFKNYSEAINGLRFELRVPEYYDTMLSEYYRSPRKRPNPIVNGEEVSWEEYNELYPDNENNYMRESFVPSVIYKAEDMNMCLAFRTIPEIIDMCDNSVPFDFVHFSDVAWILEIMDGYASEMTPYEEGVPELKAFLTRMNATRMKLLKAQEEIQFKIRKYVPSKNGPRSIGDLLRAFTSAKE